MPMFRGTVEILAFLTKTLTSEICKNIFLSLHPFGASVVDHCTSCGIVRVMYCTTCRFTRYHKMYGSSMFLWLLIGEMR